MSILTKINDNTIPTTFKINRHAEQQKEFMGTYQLIKEKFNDEYIYKKQIKIITFTILIIINGYFVTVKMLSTMV